MKSAHTNPGACEPSPLPQADEIRNRYRKSILRFVAYSDPDFYRGRITKSFSHPSDLLGTLRLRKHKDSYKKIVAEVLKTQFPETTSFKIEIEKNEQLFASAAIRLVDGHEWPEVRSEAAKLIDCEPPPILTARMVEFYNRIKALKGDKKPLTWVRLEFDGSFVEKDEILWRIALFHDQRLFIQRTGYWGHEFYLLEKPVSYLTALPLNPVLPAIPKEFERSEILNLAKFHEDLILNFESENRLLLVLRIFTREGVKKCFPWVDAETLKPKDYGDALRKLPPIEGLFQVRVFRDGCGPLIYGFCLEEGYTWQRVKETLLSKRNRVDTSELYGITPEAALLFDWLVASGAQDGKFSLSGDVEDALQFEIGINIKEFKKENLNSLLQILCEEITRKTEWNAAVVVWAESHTPKLKIRFLKKEFSPVVEQLLRHFKAKGKSVPREEIESWLNR